MNFTHWQKRVRWMQGAAGILLISALSSCNRDEAKVYHIPKEASPPSQPEPTPTPEAAQPETSSPAPTPISLPQLKYQLPKGWQEKPPSEMRVASFTVSGPNGQAADVSVIPLPVIGHDLELINMWRSRVQLPATSDPDAVNLAKPVAVGTEQGRLFEFVSEQPIIGKSRQRIMVTMLTHSAISWFFKIEGEDAFVISQKGKYLQFLKSVSFGKNAPEPMPPTPGGQRVDDGSEPAEPNWTVPPGWVAHKPSQFLLAAFSIPGTNGAKAEVNVAELDGEGGGLLANVNRWRGQLGLSAVGKNDLSQLAQTLDVPGGKATLVDFAGMHAKTGKTTRLVGAIVSQSGQTWFYKLMGDTQVVAQQKNVFTKFIQSANYANAR